ncbi:beta-glucoside-specific PTS transporter subunit IIABC [Carnobacterium pleistocenium]|uniref:beta-glucoside-specific PTS transporter subunit IIABC n=1 Tax=Carnobacterium pleistocenium TaxID=181073 RepID=UPI000558CC0D|nr:beta-glucoside-specific PTS transporter subunit IIABC [Carnobacterium pleistocenium]
MTSKVRDYEKLSKEILKAVNGKENIAGVTRCATRLRLVLKQTPQDAKATISEMPGVITVVENSGQFQIVIGTHVGDVYDEFAELVGIDEAEVVEAPKTSILNRIIATMSAVFAPFIYILAAAGILQGMLILVNLAFPSFAATGTAQVFSFISWAPFTFLPIFIAITASKHFKSNMYIAVACCAALVSPTWAELASQIASGTPISFLTIPLSQTIYTSSVLPPLLLVWFLSYFERFIEKRIPEVIKPLLVPLLSLVIMVPLTIILIGPASSLAAQTIANGYNFLAEYAPPLAGLIIGGFWQVLVIFGVHWGITPVVLENFNIYGRDSFQAFQTIAVISQVGAVLGVFLKTKNKELKGISLSAFVTGIFGITEPAIYGVTLRFKKPFIYGCISGAVGGVVASFFNPYYYAYAGLPGLLTIVNGISSENPSSFIGIVIGSLIGIIGPIILIQIFGFGEKSKSDELKESNPVSKLLNSEVFSPLKGKIMPLSEVSDEVFASGAMGKGVAIEPTDNKVYAPFDGTVEVLVDSKHAIGLRSDDGIELLIHVGLDTVKMNGQNFDYAVKSNQKVKKGDLLLTFDMDAIRDEGFSLVTMVVITNSNEYENISIATNPDSISNEPILALYNA